MVPLVTSLSLILYNVWTETEMKRLTASTGMILKGSFRPPDSNMTLEKLSKFVKSE